MAGILHMAGHPNSWATKMSVQLIHLTVVICDKKEYMTPLVIFILALFTIKPKFGWICHLVENATLTSFG